MVWLGIVFSVMSISKYLFGFTSAVLARTQQKIILDNQWHKVVQ